MSAPKAKNPFLRWSFWRMMLGMKHLTTKWQVGDGREARLADHVVATAKLGDAADAIRVIDAFGYGESYLINVGDEKGAILDVALGQALANKAAGQVLELGTYCGYSALRMAVAAPHARIVSIEFSADNAAIAQRILDHAGVSEQVRIVVGTLGDGGKTAAALQVDHGFGPGCLDLVFLDHAKQAYVPDLELIVQQGWLRHGGLAVADNVKFPGAPEYSAFMRAAEGKDWRTVAHEAHAEYQTLIKDIVLVSEYLG